MIVALPAAEERFVKKLIASGRYESDREVIRASLRLLKSRERRLLTEIEEFQQKALAGLEQCKQGKVIDGDEAFARVGRRRPVRGKRARP